MIDQELVWVLQAVSAVATATGVCFAAYYYIKTLKNTQKNMDLTLETRRIGLLREVMRDISNFEGWKNSIEVMGYQWENYGDFENKYGTGNNQDAASKRYAFWTQWNSVGSMLRKGLVNAEDLYDTGLIFSLWVWPKYQTIIEEMRRRYWGKAYLSDLEYLHGELMKVKLRRDPSYKIPETYGRYIPDR